MRSFLLPIVATCCGALTAQIDAQPLPASSNRSAANPADASPKAVVAQQIKVAPGALRGRLLDSATRQPIAEREFQITDNSGRKLADVRTSAEGAYVLPKLGVGAYTLVLANDLKLNLAVDETATATQLDLMLPQGQGPKAKPNNPGATPQDPLSYPPAPGGAAPMLPTPAPVPVAGMGFGSWALVAGGAAIVATPVVANNASGNSNERPISGSGLGVRR